MDGKTTKRGYPRLAVTALTLAAALPLLVSGQGQGTTEMSIALDEDGCPQQVNDTSDSCSAMGRPGDAGPGNACGRRGATVLRWTSPAGQEFTISFEGRTPLGGALDRSSNGGELVAAIPASTEPGSYKYSVIMIDKDACPLDPRIIVGD